jgi:DNA invertase Pin-like site-specific DNA recombinase
MSHRQWNFISRCSKLIRLGRAPTVQRRAAEIMLLKEAGVRPSEIASRLGIGRASVYRVPTDQRDADRQEAA